MYFSENMWSFQILGVCKCEIVVSSTSVEYVHALVAKASINVGILPDHKSSFLLYILHPIPSDLIHWSIASRTNFTKCGLVMKVCRFLIINVSRDLARVLCN